MVKLLKKLIFAAVIIFIIVKVVYWYNINNSVSQTGEDIAFAIESGEGARRISQKLHDTGLIKSAFYFKAYVKREGMQADLQAGEYLLNSSMTIKEIAKVLAVGNAIIEERTIKIIEGWSINEVDKYLEDNSVPDAEQIVRVKFGGGKIDVARLNDIINSHKLGHKILG